MKKRLIIWMIVAILVIGLVTFFIMNNSKNPQTSINNPNAYSGASSGSKSIAISNFAFSPITLTINKGETVVWTNQDSAPHTVTSNSGSELSSATLNNRQTYSHAFNEVGTYDYHCNFHTAMKANIRVI